MITITAGSNIKWVVFFISFWLKIYIVIPFNVILISVSWMKLSLKNKKIRRVIEMTNFVAHAYESWIINKIINEDIYSIPS